MTISIQVGDKTPEFSLIGADGMIHTLVDYKGYKGVCFFFFSKKDAKKKVILDQIEMLKEEYCKKSIAFVGVCQKPLEESFSGVLEDLKDLQLNYDILLDSTKDLTTKFGVTSLPQFFIFNQSKHLIYKGCCKKELLAPTTASNPNYIAQALDELIGGLPISVPEMEEITVV